VALIVQEYGSRSSPASSARTTISVVVADQFLELAVRELHTAFGLDADGGCSAGNAVARPAAR
jgi:hypothetical protein